MEQPESDQSHQQRQARMVQWRREPVNCRIDANASTLHAALVTKQGVIMVRTRAPCGLRSKVHMKRKPSKAGIAKITMAKNTQRIAEERVNRHFPNLEVLNSYWVGQDGKHKYYEIIMLDPAHPAIKSDKDLDGLQTLITEDVHTVERPAQVRTRSTQEGQQKSCDLPKGSWKHR